VTGDRLANDMIVASKRILHRCGRLLPQGH
jgi:hypothetical protein